VSRYVRSSSAARAEHFTGHVVWRLAVGFATVLLSTVRSSLCSSAAARPELCRDLQTVRCEGFWGMPSINTRPPIYLPRRRGLETGLCGYRARPRPSDPAHLA
jgi:hypothetical protein